MDITGVGKMKRASMWTEAWLKRLSYRDLIKLKQWFEAHANELTGLQIPRARRIEKEWRRRKCEGGGGMAAA
jgi:hypothetical protein